MHAQSVYQRVVDSSDGGHEVNYENFSSSGQIQLHGIGDDSLSMVFSPPVAFPKLAKVGQRTVMDGKIDMVEDSVRIRGIYHSEIRVLANEKVQVRAGTFNCVKVQFTIDLSLKFQKHAMHMIDTQTDWMAKGVGSVKWTEKSHTETTDNGRHKVEESLSKSSLSSYSIGVL